MTPAQRLSTVVASVIALALAGCELNSVGVQRFIVPVDSITGPDSIGPTDSLSLRFWGVVGSNGCFRFHRVEKPRQTADTLVIFFYGEHTNAAVCTQAVVLLDHTEVLAPPLSDPFITRARGPGASYRVKSTIVR